MNMPAQKQRIMLLIIGLLLTFSSMGVTPVHAATLIVQSAADGPANAANCPGVGCRLRDAIAAANAGDTITFAAAMNGQTLTPASPLTIDKNMTITGPGAANLTITGGGPLPAFDILAAGVDVTLSGMTITNVTAFTGGGIQNAGGLKVLNSTIIGNNVGIGNAGTLMVSSSTISNNTIGIVSLGNLTITGSAITGNTLGLQTMGMGQATATAMAITPTAISTPVEITDSTFSGNNAGQSGPGGGIFNVGESLIIIRSAFINNTGGGQGGGILNIMGTLVFINSTFAGNSAAVDPQTGTAGGAIFNMGTLTLINSTLSGNSATDGGGVYNSEGGMTTIQNSILSANTGGNCLSDIPADITDNGNNIDDGTSCGFTVSVLNGTDPLLGPLGDYGGPTQTLPLLLDSPAIDAGNSTECANPATVNNLDQRGIARPQGAVCDIGAYEFQSGTTTTVVSSLNPSTYGDSVTFTATVSDSEAPSSPTGTVTFRDGVNDICTDVPLTSGSAPCPISALLAGDHTIAAVYTSDSSFTGSTSDPITQTVTMAGQGTLTVHAGSPLTYNTSETLSTTGGSGTGAVTYQLTAGSCILAGDQLTANSGTGTCTVTATKAADGNYSATTSTPATVTLQAGSQTTLSLVAPGTLVYGMTVGLNTTGGSGTGGVLYEVISGNCSIIGNQLTANSGTGTCTVTATKAADANNSAATSAPATITLQIAATTMQLTMNSPNPSTFGQSVAFTAAVSPAAATGTVTFYDGAAVLGTGTLSGGIATFSTAGLSAGTHTITAFYPGDANYGTSTSSAVDQVVNAAAIAPTDVPTMSEWGMILFMLLAGMGAVFYLRRQSSRY